MAWAVQQAVTTGLESTAAATRAVTVTTKRIQLMPGGFDLFNADEPPHHRGRRQTCRQLGGVLPVRKGWSDEVSGGGVKVRAGPWPHRMMSIRGVRGSRF
ncbi:hypothetical protein [Actinoallomurus sp. NPDC050550]|uniref:hypothetical protein n=1 Tax=Actinoallomurus sp. NPDC050550 TaxID=3154937 RepID=UPI003405CBF2